MEVIKDSGHRPAVAKLLNLCRSCLKPHRVGSDDNAPVSLETHPRGMPTLNDMLMETTRLRAPPDKPMPTHLCSSCAAALYSSFAFRKMCITSHDSLMMMLEEVNNVPETLNLTLPKPEDLDFEMNLCKARSFPCVLQNQAVQTELSGDAFRSYENDTKLIDRTVECLDCKETFDDQICYSKHMSEVHNIDTASCQGCKLIFDDSNALNEHAKSCKWLESKLKPESVEFVNIPPTINTSIAENLVKVEFSDTEDNYMDSNDYFEFQSSETTPTKAEHEDVIEAESPTSKNKTKSTTRDNSFCDICQRQFPTSESLKQHMVMHRTPVHQCEVCGKTFTRSTHKKRHQLIHQKLKNFNCIQCNKIFHRKDHLQRHLQMHSIKKMYECSTCDEKFISELKLAKHTITHSQKIVVHPCEVCGKEFTRSTHKRRHLLVHQTAPKEFKCDNCNKIFRRKHHLERHALLHENEKVYDCTKCDKKFPTEFKLATHQVTHGERRKYTKSFKCDVCDRAYTLEKSLKVHMRMHNGETAIHCQMCPSKFHTKWQMKDHTLKCHQAERRFLCSECGKRFYRFDYFKVHMRRHRGDNPHKCQFCGKGFPRAADLRAHEKYHTGEKPNVCTVCGLGFTRPYSLKVHLRVHSGEKPYVCKDCGKKFAQSYDLKLHMRTHTGERLKCDRCDDVFIRDYLLRQHKKNVHGIVTECRVGRLNNKKGKDLDVDEQLSNQD